MKLSSKKHFLATGALTSLVAICSAETLTISLADALRLADENNADLAIQVENAKQAAIESQQAWLQWLPTVRYGSSYAHQDGLLQETGGNLLDVERNGRFDGFGGGGIGSGLAGNPGISLEIDIADAVFAPQSERHRKLAAEANSEATRLIVAVEVAEAYYQLAQSQEALILAETASRQADELSKITEDYAEAGQGLKVDAERAAVEALLQKQYRENARYALHSASAELASLLQVDADLRATPAALAPLRLSGLDQSLESLLATARAARPETQAALAQRKAAAVSERQATLSPLLPRVGASYTDTDFGGGVGSNKNADGSREESTIAIYWQLDQLGLGSFNKRRLAQSRLRQSEALERQTQAQVGAEVVRAYARWQSAQRQLDLARQMIERARYAFELDRQRIFENQALPLESLQSQQTLARAELAYIDAVATYNITQIELIASIGEEFAP